MKRLKIKDTYHKIIDGFDVNESSREVKYSNVKIDFTGKGIADLPLKYQECQLVDGDFRHIDAEEGQRIEGTNFQVNQQEEKLSELEYVKGQTTQTGTPTPTSPQPINITTGRQVVSVCGKNLFSGVFRQGNISSLSNTARIFSTQNLYLESGKSYTISTNLNTSLYKYAIALSDTMYPSSTNFYDSGWKTISSFTFTPSRSGYFGLGVAKSNGTDNITPNDISNINWQLETGNQPSTYEEYKGNDYEINLGKNLLSNSTFRQGNAGGSVSGNRIFCDANYLLKANYTYTLSTNLDTSVYRYNILTSLTPFPSANTIYNSGWVTTSSKTFTPTQDTYIGINLGKINDGNITPTDIEGVQWQLEKGSQATSYTPYKTPIELCKIGTYQNRIFKNTQDNPLYDSNLEEGQWYIHKEIGRVVVNGTESGWALRTNTSPNYIKFRNDNLFPSDVKERLQLKSNYFVANSGANDAGYSGNAICGNVGQYAKWLHVSIDNTIVSDVATFKTWLGTHNLEIYYVLNTPTNTLIEDEELINQLNSIELLEGLNNVSVSSPYLPGIIGLHYNFQVEQDIEKVNEVIYTGYVNNYTLPKMKNKLEYRELDIDLLSPLALATLRTTDAVGTYNLRDLIREIIQPLIDDGFTLKELNIGNNQISVNYLTETIESSLNKLSNKFNFWWYIDKNKNIFINDISYIFNKNKVLTYDDNNKINGLIDFTPSMESIDYCNTIDFSNVRLFTYSYYSLRYRTIGGENIPYYTSYNPMFKKETLNPGDEITFDIPFVINTSKSGLTDTSYQTSDYCFKIEKKVGLTYPIAVQLLQDSNNQVIIPSNATISDSFNESKEFVFVRDNFFKNLIVGMKYNGSSAITISDISSTTALMLTKLRISDNSEIEKNKDIISTTGIVEKQIDANEQWLTYNQVLEIAKSLIGNNNVNVEKVNMLTDNENNLKVGDIITIDKPGFLTNGDFVITDKKRKYYDNVDQWEFILNNTNILESYIDLFRSTDEQENEEEKFSLITGSYSNEGVIEKYEVDVQ